MKITELTQEQFNLMDKTKFYRQIETITEDEQVVNDWMKYRGTPKAEVFKFVRRPGSVIWRVGVTEDN